MRAAATGPPCRRAYFAGATRGTLLCQDDRGLLAIRIRGDALLRLPAFPLATGESLVAACDEPCSRLKLIDPKSVEPRPSFRWAASYDGDFSPDGRTLAVPVQPRGAGGPRSRARVVAIVDVRDRVVTHVEPERLGPWGALTFSTDGWLFYATAAGAVMAQHPDLDEAVEVGSARSINVLDLAAD